MSGTVQRKVAGVDTYTWSEADPANPGRPQVHWANRGDIIDVSAEEAARGESILETAGLPPRHPGIPALVDVDWEPEPEPEVFNPATDAALAAMTVAEVQAYLTTVPEEQHADELDRVVEAEQLRDKPRVSILGLHPDFEPHPDDVDSDA